MGRGSGSGHNYGLVRSHIQGGMMTQMVISVAICHELSISDDITVVMLRNLVYSGKMVSHHEWR